MTMQRKLATTGILLLGTMYATMRLDRHPSSMLMSYRSIVASIIRIVLNTQGQAAGLALPTDVDRKFPIPPLSLPPIDSQLNRNRNRPQRHRPPSSTGACSKPASPSSPPTCPPSTSSSPNNPSGPSPPASATRSRSTPCARTAPARNRPPRSSGSGLGPWSRVCGRRRRAMRPRSPPP